MKAQEIENAKPGDLFVIKGELWMRLADSNPLQISGHIVKLKTGEWCHWARLVNWDEEIS